METLGARDQIKCKAVSHLHGHQVNTRLIQTPLPQKHVTRNALNDAESHAIANGLERADDRLTSRLMVRICVSLDAGRMVSLGACGHLESQGISNTHGRQIDT